MSIPNSDDLVMIRRGDFEALKQEAIFGVFRRDAVEFDKLNALLANAPVVSDNKDSVRHLWECLGTWSAYLATNGEDANLAPPSWLVEAITKATTPQPAPNADDVRDAERYRYLRDCGHGFDLSVREETEEGEIWVTGYPPDELNKAIDQALATYDKLSEVKHGTK